MKYQTNWQPNRNKNLRRAELQIVTTSGVLVAIVSHVKDVAAAIAAFESAR